MNRGVGPSLMPCGRQLEFLAKVDGAVFREIVVLQVSFLNKFVVCKLLNAS